MTIGSDKRLDGRRDFGGGIHPGTTRESDRQGFAECDGFVRALDLDDQVTTDFNVSTKRNQQSAADRGVGNHGTRHCRQLNATARRDGRAAGDHANHYVFPDPRLQPRSCTEVNHGSRRDGRGHGDHRHQARRILGTVDLTVICGSTIA